MPLETKDQDELEAIVRGAIRADIPGADVSPGSDYDVSAKVAATAARLGQAQAADAVRQIFPGTADADSLERHASRRGMSAQPAAKARGLVQVASDETITVLDPITRGAELTHDDGTAYVTTEAIQLATGPSGKSVAGGSTEGRLILAPDAIDVLPDHVFSIDGNLRAIREVIGGGTDVVDLYEPLPVVPAHGTELEIKTAGVIAIEAALAGASGNRPVGDLLTFTDPVTGIEAVGRVLELSGGGDAETMDELRGQREVAAVRDTNGVAPFWIEIDEPLPGTPVPNFDPGIFPGGPLAAAVLEAVESYFDRLGPSVRGARCERHPDPSIAWDDTVRTGALAAAAEAIPGAVSAVLAEPTADVQPGALQTARLGRLIVRLETP